MLEGVLTNDDSDCILNTQVGGMQKMIDIFLMKWFVLRFLENWLTVM